MNNLEHILKSHGETKQRFSESFTQTVMRFKLNP